jgi:hypothetical protein
VPDPHGEAYDKMIRQHRLMLQNRTARAPQSPPSPSSQPSASDRQPTEGSERGFFGRHPSVGGSLVPVLGSARVAYADYLDHDYVGAGVNAALAVGDLSGEGFVLNELRRGGAKVVGSNAWKTTRKWMGDKGLLDAGQHGHHWLIPRKSAAPDWLKNQPWNIKGMPSPEVHGRIHGRYAGKPQFNAVQRYWYGVPAWAKVQHGLAAEHVGAGVYNGLNSDDQ